MPGAADVYGGTEPSQGLFGQVGIKVVEEWSRASEEPKARGTEEPAW
jgi:hypothetical protein